MSANHEALHRKIRALRRTRGQLEPMVHPGLPEAQKLWEELEKRFSDLENQAKQLTRGTEDSLGGSGEVVGKSINEIRQGYDRLASKLREPRSDSLWGQVRKNLDRLVEGGHRTAECLADSVEDLADATKVRMTKARLERTRFKKRAELGTRVYELAKESGRAEGASLLVLDDDRVTALLRDLGALDADIWNTASNVKKVVIRDARLGT